MKGSKFVIALSKWENQFHNVGLSCNKILSFDWVNFTCVKSSACPAIYQNLQDEDLSHHLRGLGPNCFVNEKWLKNELLQGCLGYSVGHMLKVARVITSYVAGQEEISLLGLQGEKRGLQMRARTAECRRRILF